MKKNIFLLFILCLFVAKARAQIVVTPCTPISVCEGAVMTDACMVANTSTLIGGTWSSSNTGIATVSAGEVTGVSSGTATISYTFNIPSYATIIFKNDVTVVAPPSAAPSHAPVCDGGTLYLSANDEGGNTYSWSGPDAFTSTEQNPTIGSVTSAIEGTYSLTITSPGGCVGNYTVAVTLGAYTVSVNQISPMLLSGDKVHTYWGTSFTLEAVTVPAVPATGVTYTWTGPEPSTSSLASFSPTFAPSAAVVNPYTVTVAFNGCSVDVPDTIIVYSGCSPYDYFSVNGYRSQKGMDALAGCSDCSTIQPFHTITSTELTAANVTDGEYYFVPQSVVCNKPTLTDNVFFMGDSTYVRIDSGSSVEINHCHFYSCDWVGIIVNQGTDTTTHLQIHNNTLIENATTVMNNAYAGTRDAGGAGVSVWPNPDGRYFAGMPDILESDGVIYNKDSSGINIYDYQPSVNGAGDGTKLPYTIRNSVFINKELAGNDAGSLSTNNYPFSWPSVALLKAITAYSKVPVYGVNAYRTTAYRGAAIMVRNVGSSEELEAGDSLNPATYAYNYLEIGDDDDSLSANLYDSLRLPLQVHSSNIKLYNNTFRNTDTALHILRQPGDSTSKHACIIAGSREDNTHNRFYNCAFGICMSGSFPVDPVWNLSCKEADFAGIIATGMVRPSHALKIYQYASLGLIDFRNNYLYHYGIDHLVLLPGSVALRGHIVIANNTIIGKDSATHTNIVPHGVILTGLFATPATNENGSFHIDSNYIQGTGHAIDINNLKNRVYMNDNKIVLYPHVINLHNIIAGLYGIRSPNIIEMQRNKEKGVGYYCHNGVLLAGSKLLQCGNAMLPTDVSCNLMQDLNFGFLIEDTCHLNWHHNEMRRNYVGLAMYGNPASIGRQGDVCEPSDNRWTAYPCDGDPSCINCAAFPGWDGMTAFNIQTDDSVANDSSVIYIRTDDDTTYLPIHNISSSGAYTYSFVNGLKDAAIGCGSSLLAPVECGPIFAAKGASVAQAGNTVTTAAHGKMQLFPNPSEGSVTIAVTDAPYGAAKVRVVNTVGVEVYDGMHTFDGGATVLNLSNLPSGMYIIQLADSKGNVKTGRVLIEK